MLICFVITQQHGQLLLFSGKKVQTNEYPALWPERARTAVNIQQLFHNDDALIDLQAEIEADIPPIHY